MLLGHGGRTSEGLPAGLSARVYTQRDPTFSSVLLKLSQRNVNSFLHRSFSTKCLITGLGFNLVPVSRGFLAACAGAAPAGKDGGLTRSQDVPLLQPAHRQLAPGLEHGSGKK